MLAGGLPRDTAEPLPGWLANLVAFQAGWWAATLALAARLARSVRP